MDRFLNFMLVLLSLGAIYAAGLLAFAFAGGAFSFFYYGFVVVSRWLGVWQ